jgi:hypothetical protein
VTIVSSGQRNGFNCVSRRADLGKCAIKLLLVVGHNCPCRRDRRSYAPYGMCGTCYSAPNICSLLPLMAPRLSSSVPSLPAHRAMMASLGPRCRRAIRPVGIKKPRYRRPERGFEADAWGAGGLCLTHQHWPGSGSLWVRPRSMPLGHSAEHLRSITPPSQGRAWRNFRG